MPLWLREEVQDVSWASVVHLLNMLYVQEQFLYISLKCRLELVVIFLQIFCCI